MAKIDLARRAKIGRDRRERTRAQILKAGATLLAEGAALTLDAVAEAAGLAKGTFYYHFDNVEELIAAVNPYWEVLELRTQRESYAKTTGEWLRRMRSHEAQIRKQWGDQVYQDYERYLDTCVRAFRNHWSSDVQMKLRQIPE